MFGQITDFGFFEKIIFFDFGGPKKTKYLKVTFKYELDSKKGPSCLTYNSNEGSRLGSELVVLIISSP